MPVFLGVFIWPFAFYVQMANVSNSDPTHMARLEEKLDALVAHLSASTPNLRSVIASKPPSKRPLIQSTIESDGDNLVFKKPKPNLKGPTKMALKLKTVSSRDFVGVDDPLPGPSTSSCIPTETDQYIMEDSVASDEDDGIVDSVHCDEKFEGDDLEHALLGSDDNDAPSSNDFSDALTKAIPIIDLDAQGDLHEDLPGISTCDDLPIIGEKSSSTWTPPPKTFAWFCKVADLGIADEQFRSLDDTYSPPDSFAHYFVPAKLPPAVWDSVRQNRVSTLKLKACHKAQTYITSALKPLLSVLDALDPADRENRSKLAYVVQLLSTSNLQFNRLKRAMSTPFIRKEFRKTMLSQPITHNSLFGEDFVKTTELALKDVASTSKILHTRQPFRKSFQSQGRSNPGPSRPQSDHSAVGQASGSGPYNPGYNPYRGRGGRGRGSPSFRGRSSSSGFRKKH